jgi:hypothetical protein
MNTFPKITSRVLFFHLILQLELEKVGFNAYFLGLLRAQVLRFQVITGRFIMFSANYKQL